MQQCQFHHGQLAFMFWLWVYIVTPVLVPTIWLINRRTDPGTLESHDARLPRPVRSFSLAIAGTGPMPMMRGSTPALAHPVIFAIGLKPRARA